MLSLLLYFGVFLVSLLFISLDRMESRYYGIFSVIGILILIIFAGGRYKVGTDFDTYINIYERYSSYSWNYIKTNADIGILFAALSKILYSIGGRVFTNGIYAAMIILLTYSTMSKEFKDVYFVPWFFTFLCIYYTSAFNIMRQFISISIVFWGLKFVFSNKPLYFFTIILIAFGFHKASLIAIIFWFLWDHKNNCAIEGRRFYRVLILFIIFALFYQPIVRWLGTSFKIFNEYISYSESSSLANNKSFFLLLFEIVVLFSLRNKIIELDSRNAFFYKLLILALIINLTGFSQPFVKRISVYFSMPSILVLAGFLPYCFTEKSRNLSILLICLYSAFRFILTAYVFGQGDLIPYNFYLF